MVQFLKVPVKRILKINNSPFATAMCHSLSNNIILDWFKLKAFPEDKSLVSEKFKFV